MNAEIIKIGNSRGLRIPKVLLAQCKIKNKVQLTVQNHALIITPYEEARRGWEKSFQIMAKTQDDKLMDARLTEHSWDKEEWQW